MLARIGGMQISTVIMKNYMEAPQKLIINLPLDTAISIAKHTFFLRHYLQ